MFFDFVMTFVDVVFHIFYTLALKNKTLKLNLFKGRQYQHVLALCAVHNGISKRLFLGIQLYVCYCLCILLCPA